MQAATIIENCARPSLSGLRCAASAPLHHSSYWCVSSLRTPIWPTLGRILYYGTLSELDNEDLHVQVWDWNRTHDRKIGQRLLPLRGVIDTQSLYCKLGSFM